jgi:hypothetical protein
LTPSPRARGSTSNFRAVLRERLAERAPEVALADRTGPERLAALQDRLSGAPDWIRLLTWEALERSGRGPVEREVRRATLEQWVAAVEAAQAEGALPGNLDARQLVLAELGMVLLPLAFPQLTRLVTGQAPTSPEFLSERRAFLEELGNLLTG